MSESTRILTTASNIALERPAGSHALAAAAHRER
jgi:multisubunit Na+/H+ antiporter MnhG subunit